MDLNKGKILLITDAWHPQVNGVTRTIDSIITPLKNRGYNPIIISPNMFRTFSFPAYPEIRLAIDTHKVWNMIKKNKPDFIHIFTEGPIGIAAKMYCIINGIKHSSSFHTRYPEYIKKMWGVPTDVAYNYLKWFHSSSDKVLVPTESIRVELFNRGFNNLVVWSRGVDHTIFNNRFRRHNKEFTYIYVGRVSVEKNLSIFLDMKLDGRKVIVGDGPLLSEFKKKYKEVTFTGFLKGAALTKIMCDADIFIFPSLSDTFGIVIIEAMACGLPVIAFNVTGPKDIIVSGTGLLAETDEEFENNCKNASKIKWDRDICKRHAMTYTWDNVTEIFLKNLCGV